MMCNFDMPERRQPPINPGDDSSLSQMAIKLKKAPSEALSRLMAKEFLRCNGGGAFFCEGDHTACLGRIRLR